MMQRVGAADLRPCSCPGGLSLLRGHKVSRSSNAQKTCMKANTFQVEVHPSQAPKRKHESSFSLCHNLIVVNTAHISPADQTSALGLTLLFLAVQIDVPEGIPVDEVMKRFKNESRRVNTVGEVSYISTACVTTSLPCLPRSTLADLSLTPVSANRCGDGGILSATKTLSNAKRNKNT